MHVGAPLVFDVQKYILTQLGLTYSLFCVQFSVLECTPCAREVVLALKRILHIFHKM